MDIAYILWAILYLCAFIAGIVGLIFYKSVKSYFIKITFANNPLGLPQQSDFHTNFVLKGLLIFLIFFGMAGMFKYVNDYILKW